MNPLAVAAIVGMALFWSEPPTTIQIHQVKSLSHYCRSRSYLSQAYWLGAASMQEAPLFHHLNNEYPLLKIFSFSVRNVPTITSWLCLLSVFPCLNVSPSDQIQTPIILKSNLTCFKKNGLCKLSFTIKEKRNQPFGCCWERRLEEESKLTRTNSVSNLQIIVLVSNSNLNHHPPRQRLLHQYFVAFVGSQFALGLIPATTHSDPQRKYRRLAELFVPLPQSPHNHDIVAMP